MTIDEAVRQLKDLIDDPDVFSKLGKRDFEAICTVLAYLKIVRANSERH